MAEHENIKSADALVHERRLFIADTIRSTITLWQALTIPEQRVVYSAIMSINNVVTTSTNEYDDDEDN